MNEPDWKSRAQTAEARLAHLATWIRARAELEQKSYDEWKAAGADLQAAYRSGMVFALEETEKVVKGQFN